MPVVWYPGYWMLCSKGLAGTQLLNPDARTDLKPLTLTSGKWRLKDPWGSLFSQPNLARELWIPVGDWWSLKE